jgi:hypothetical protein
MRAEVLNDTDQEPRRQYSSRYLFALRSRLGASLGFRYLAQPPLSGRFGDWDSIST